ncbi:YhgE/Pip domain-containing protein [Halobacillus litoralis]|uniref:YhgE/Pip domain-containing protein n=1 Tax=Halobacillus litoralis TaxID=45668 RepID=UPI001CFCED9C|nr:ABC transporter permease [Halobacillus litoralis]
MFKNKLVMASPIIALAVLFIFSLTLIPSLNVQPKDLQIAIVNMDEGAMGQTIVDTMNQPSDTDDDSVVEWVQVKSEKAAQEGLDKRAYYGALVIPKDFSEKQASLQSAAPISPEVKIYVNQGMNMAASTMAGQVMNGVVDNMNNKIRTQLLEGFKAQDTALTIEQASMLATPISKNVTNVNEVGENSANGNSPITMFQPLWMGSLAGAAIIFMAISKMNIHSRKENLLTKMGQIIMGAVVALVIGFGFTWMADGMLGLNIPNFIDTALFLSITSFSFFLLISAVLSLVGFKGIAIFVLLLFFGGPLLALAPEMMSPFYRDWIYSWLPMRFMVEGLRELFFFGEELTWSTPVAVLVWIGVGSILIILANAFKPTSKKQDTEVNS